MSSNSVQSFMIDICNGTPIENGLHNKCLAPAVPYLYLYVDVIGIRVVIEPRFSVFRAVIIFTF